jgi:hypothetical protein
MSGAAVECVGANHHSPLLYPSFRASERDPEARILLRTRITSIFMKGNTL